MAHANYSVSTYTSIETENDSVALGQIASSIILIITPDPGFSVSASVFSVGGATEGPANTFTGGNVSPEVASVTFTDTTVAGQGNNLVHAEVIFNNFIMPASNKDILVDRMLNGVKNKDLADKYSLPLQTIKNRVRRGKVLIAQEVNSNLTVCQ